jgi:hypothetical protein
MGIDRLETTAILVDEDGGEMSVDILWVPSLGVRE